MRSPHGRRTYSDAARLRRVRGCSPSSHSDENARRSSCSNSDGNSGDSAIGPLWQKFYQEHVLDKIPNKADQNIVQPSEVKAERK